MISRYTRPEMGAIWSEENKLQKWLDVEIAALYALAKHGYIPKNVPALVKKKAKFTVERTLEIEKIVNHDVIAFLTNVSENVGPVSRYVHYGLTSSDILDTGLALQVCDASRLIRQEIVKLIDVLGVKAREHEKTLMVGRSHGVHAEPITFGLKLAVFYAEFQRNLVRFDAAAENMRYGQMSGAVGTFAHIDPKVEKEACRLLNLNPAPASTQVLQRDRHAEYMTTLAVLAGSLEKLATEMRGLQKTETLEVQEYFAEGQKGSSAMPHKRNPITCERIAGLARIIRGNAMAALENIALWHERDITHSSVERVIFPDTTILVHYMLTLMSSVIKNLVVFPKNMFANMEKSRGIVFSQGLLLKLIRKDLTREEAYALVQRAAKKVWDEGITLKEAVRSDEGIMGYLSRQEVEEAFDYDYHMRNVPVIMSRVGIPEVTQKARKAAHKKAEAPAAL